MPIYLDVSDNPFPFLGIFPGSAEDVEKALQLDRLKRNVPVDSANWDMLEQLIALEARKTNMVAFAEDLYHGALEAYKALWPGQTTPTDPSDLGNDLQLSKVHVGQWRDSGARVGADEALTYFLSWYEKVDLETLRSVREGSMWTTDMSPMHPIFLMLHACFYTICLVFRYTSWHFYAFSGTNLLTRCHSASSLFSAIFVFQKCYTGNILGIG
jgi:hypothetical protein